MIDEGGSDERRLPYRGMLPRSLHGRLLQFRWLLLTSFTRRSAVEAFVAAADPCLDRLERHPESGLGCYEQGTQIPLRV